MRIWNRCITAVLAFTVALNIVQVSEAASPEKTAYTYTGLGNKVKKEDEELTQKYEKGITMQKEQIKARKERLKELGLEKEADKDYFLPKEYYSRFSVSELEQKGMTLLIRCMTSEDIEKWEKRVRSKIQFFYITRGNELISWTNSVGITTRTYAFDVDGNIAFCGDHGKTAPVTGAPHSAYIPVGNKDIEKVLYYGYGGPKDEMTKLGYSKAKSYVIMAMLVSNFRRGKQPGASGRIFWDYIKNMPDPPENMGGAYYVETNNDSLQDLFFYKKNPKGTLAVQKKSQNEPVTDQNTNYSLKGATFGVYTDPDAKTGAAAVLTTDQNGHTQQIELEEGTYYVREITAPEGYLLDRTVYPVTVQYDRTAQVYIEDSPVMKPAGLLIEKRDKETGKNEPQGTATLEGAEFTVCYYKDLLNPDMKDSHKKPYRTWTFKTDEKGQCKYDDAYKISGDPLFINEEQKPSLPYGTVTVEETKAPEGYEKNNELFIQHITADEKDTSGFWEHGIIVPENAVTLELEKISEDGHTKIKGAEFEYLRPDGQKETLVTDEKGKIVIKGLMYGTHQLKETKAPEGYMTNKNSIRFTVDENKKAVQEPGTDPGYGSIKFLTQEGGNIHVFVEDRLSEYELEIIKKNEKDVKLKDAVFTLYEDKECKKEAGEYVTDENGKAVIPGLKVKTKYYLKETKAPEGYKEDPEVFEICRDKIPEEGRYPFTVINETSKRLPDTGKSSMLFIICLSLTIITIYISKRKERD